MKPQRTRYQEALRDPRWQRRRLEIMSRDCFTCQFCFNKDRTLNVHHRWYVADAQPWEYPDIALVTLCEVCHHEETFLRQQVVSRLVRALGTSGMSVGQLAVMAAAFDSRQLTVTEAQLVAHRIADVLTPRPTLLTVAVEEARV